MEDNPSLSWVLMSICMSFCALGHTTERGLLSSCKDVSLYFLVIFITFLGGGASSLNETMGTMNMNSIKQTSFCKIEEEISKWWQEALETALIEDGKEERKLAIENNSFHEGVPAITVICDGGWSKRTHKHTYNANGVVGVSIGQKTKKLLYLGVRNKYCYICAMAEARHEKAAEHECFKNWTESSQSMEADIIVEGFQNAEKQHGLRYINVVADGDSSVFAKIQEKVPVWGRRVKKKECSNHVCKCLRSNLEKLVEERPEFKGKNKLTKFNRIRIVSAVRCPIKLADPNDPQRIKKLRHNIKNSVYHVFGVHKNCSDFCKANEETSSNTDIEKEEDDKHDTGDFVGDVMDEQAA